MPVKDCFVIMPFSDSKTNTESKWTEIFTDLFKPAWTDLGLNCDRANVPRGSITRDIIEKLFSASVVFADLTDSNPNVMYELGVRHTFHKPTIMVQAKGSEIPFGVKAYKVHEYENTPTGLKNMKQLVKMEVEDIERYPNRSDNPVWDSLSTSNFIMEHYRNTEAVEKLKVIKEELNGNITACSAFIGQLGQHEEEEFDPASQDFFSRIRSDALRHLKITRYVTFSSEDWAVLNQADEFYRWCHSTSRNMMGLALDDTDKQRIDREQHVLGNAMSLLDRRILELEEKG